jgi:hypothetical protein
VGEAVNHEIEHGEMKLRRAMPTDLAHASALSANLTEWD